MVRPAKSGEVEDAEAEDDEEYEEVDEAELELAEFLERLGGGSSRISAKVSRILRPEDEGKVSEGFICRLLTVDPDTLEDKILEAGEGGLYDVEFKVDGKYVRGGKRRIAIGGPAKVKGAAKPVEAAPTRPEVNEADLRAKIEREHEERNARERRDAQRVADAVAVSVGPIAKAMEALQARIVSAPMGPIASPFDEAVKLVNLIEKKRDSGEASPETKALAAQVQSLTSQLATQAKEAEKAERAAFEARILERLDAREEAPRPTSGVKELLAPITEAFAISKSLRAMNDDAEESGDDDFKDLIDVVKKPLFAFLKSTIKKTGKAVGKALTDRAKGPSVPATFPLWLDLVLKDPSKPNDVEFMRASLTRYRREIESGCRVTDKATLIAFIEAEVNAHVPDAAKVATAALDEHIHAILGSIAAIRESVRVADSTPAPSSEPGPEDDDEDEEDGE